MKDNLTATLLIHCPDKEGLIASITEFLRKNGGNIVHLEQHVDAPSKVFFMRVEWELEGFRIPHDEIATCFESEIAFLYHMVWKLYFSHGLPRMAIFVSRLPHCLYDILARYRSGEWKVEIPLIVSNHPELKSIAENFGIPFHIFPVTPSTRLSQEEKQLELLRKHKIDFIVLARYMQVLTSNFVEEYREKAINIHHSFLPAFPGAKPYHSAHARGVKIIGATSHFVTAELDAGPIIDQDVVQVSHRDSISDMIRKGRDLEKVVLSERFGTI